MKLNKNEKVEKALANVGVQCPDCGCELVAGHGGACPRCGLRSGDEPKDVKVMNIGDVYNPYAVEYNSICEKIQAGEESEATAEEYVSDMEYKSDCGDDMAQHFLATRIYDEKRDGKRILGLLTEAAETGNHLAELALGGMYARGTFGKADLEAATRMYRKSAERGNPISMVNLGDRFMRGECVKKDAKKAIGWYERALKSGWVEAAKALAVIYSSDEAMPHDYALANEYGRMAAEKGDNQSRYALFKVYWNGCGVERNVGEALMWCRLAAEDGYVEAQMALAECYEDGRGVNQDRAEGLRWYEKAASCGSCRAMLALAVRYCLGLGCEKNYGRAYYLTMTALDKGYDEALWQMSHCLRNGYGVKQDIEKANKYLVQALDKNTAAAWNSCKPETATKEFDVRMRWAGNDSERMMKLHYWFHGSECDDLALKALDKAVELGSTEGMWCLGYCAHYGFLGVARNPAKAFEWYKRTAEQGDLRGKCYLGLAYRDGLGVERDVQTAGRLLKEAAEQGLAVAEFEYSKSLFEGTGVEKNEGLAIEYLKRAAESQYPAAAGAWGVRLMRGDLVKQDVPQGIEWLEFAARNGQRWAWAYLGRCFMYGDVVGVDYKCAHDYLLRATEGGDGDACSDLSRLVARGLGCPKDIDLSFKLLNKAIEMGSLTALCNKGDICRANGKLDKAIKCYSQAAEAGSAEGKYALAVMYWRGEGMNQNVAKAAKLAKEAVLAGAEDVEGLVSELSDANHNPIAEAEAEAPEHVGVTIGDVVRWLCIGVVVLIVLEMLKLGK